MQVDQEVNLLEGLSFAEGVTLVKLEIEMDGQQSVISDPSHFTPDLPGTCTLIFTVKTKNGKTSEIRAENLIIKPLSYTAVAINSINPVEILPIIGQVE